MIRPTRLYRALYAATILLLTTPMLAAEDAELASDDRIAELERKVEILSEELERTRTEMALPEEPALESVYGLGPAASKVYGLARGLSLGGYAEARYTAFVADKGDKKNEIDFLRFVLYAGYKFTERILFNSELEIERGKTDELSQKAPRPRYSVLDCSRAAGVGVTMRPWREALADYLRSPDGLTGSPVALRQPGRNAWRGR